MWEKPTFAQFQITTIINKMVFLSVKCVTISFWWLNFFRSFTEDITVLTANKNLWKEENRTYTWDISPLKLSTNHSLSNTRGYQKHIQTLLS